MPSEEISPEWRAEIDRRLADMNAAEARGVPHGRALSFEELLREVKSSDQPSGR